MHGAETTLRRLDSTPGAEDRGGVFGLPRGARGRTALLTELSSRTEPEPEGCVLAPPVLTGNLQLGALRTLGIKPDSFSTLKELLRNAF